MWLFYYSGSKVHWDVDKLPNECRSRRNGDPLFPIIYFTFDQNVRSRGNGNSSALGIVRKNKERSREIDRLANEHLLASISRKDWELEELWETRWITVHGKIQKKVVGSMDLEMNMYRLYYREKGEAMENYEKNWWITVLGTIRKKYREINRLESFSNEHVLAENEESWETRNKFFSRRLRSSNNNALQQAPSS